MEFVSQESNATPFKSGDREKVVRYASLYCLHMADKWMQQSQSSETDDLAKFLEWLDKTFWIASQNIIVRKDKGVKFGDNDTYDLSPEQIKLKKIEEIQDFEGVAKYIYSAVAVFWDKYNKSNSLTKFTTKFLPKFTKDVVDNKI